MTRVFLNLFGNGFYASTKRQHDGAGPDFRPTLKVATRDRPVLTHHAGGRREPPAEFAKCLNRTPAIEAAVALVSCDFQTAK
jgi:hypothetical protein